MEKYSSEKDLLLFSAGTTATSGDYKTHTFNSSSNFVVSGISSTPSNNDVSYLVVGLAEVVIIEAAAANSGFEEEKLQTHPTTSSAHI